eukprot:749972-Rhodomonas_salina.1
MQAFESGNTCIETRSSTPGDCRAYPAVPPEVRWHAATAGKASSDRGRRKMESLERGVASEGCRERLCPFDPDRVAVQPKRGQRHILYQRAPQRAGARVRQGVVREMQRLQHRVESNRLCQRHATCVSNSVVFEVQ